MAAVFLVLFHWGLVYLTKAFTHETTDDAAIESNIVAIAPRVSGQVAKVHIKDNQLMKKGDLLVEIEPQDFEVRLAQKQASTQTTKANLKTILSMLQLMTAKVTTAAATAKQAHAKADASRAAFERAQADCQRARQLRREETISPQEFDRALATANEAAANLKADEENAAADDSKVIEAKTQFSAAEAAVDYTKAQIHQAETDVRAAELDLSYTKIIAPCDGRVTHKSVEPGAYVQVGQSLMALVPTYIWVVANFKETQLTDMSPGQPAEIHVDAWPDTIFHGHVDSIMAGSGARFSLLPPENAVGNYVKVVQRVPVKILFDDDPKATLVLGPGMSVVPSVRTSNLNVSPVILWASAVVLAVLMTLGVLRVIAHLRD
jgi:membrane fusion protein, multidrug efflux system